MFSTAVHSSSWIGERHWTIPQAFAPPVRFVGSERQQVLCSNYFTLSRPFIATWQSWEIERNREVHLWTPSKTIKTHVFGKKKTYLSWRLHKNNVYGHRLESIDNDSSHRCVSEFHLIYLIHLLIRNTWNCYDGWPLQTKNLVSQDIQWTFLDNKDPPEIKHIRRI